MTTCRGPAVDPPWRTVIARRRTTPASRARRETTPRVPSPAPGERVVVLEVPFEERAAASAAGARWYPGTGWAWVGRDLPEPLVPYRARRYSWAEWQQDDLNGAAPTATPAPDAGLGSYALYRTQGLDVRMVLEARAAGAPEFLIGSDVGTGKTLVALSAVKRMAGVRTVLVVAPLSVLPNWRAHLEEVGDGGKRWCLINYESVKKLLTPPASAAHAKRQRTKNLQTVSKGTPKVAWDVVITDECHALADPESQQTRALDAIIAGPQGRAAFAVRMSATAGSNPAQLSYLHRGLAWSQGQPVQARTSVEAYEAWCQARGVDVTKSRYGNSLTWEGDRHSLKVMHRLIYQATPRWATRRRPDWPTQQRIPVPVDLTPAEARAYEQEWSRFTRELEALERGARGVLDGKARAARQAKGLAAQTRYRQKAGLIRAAGTAQFVAGMVAKGKQVAVSCEYIDTVQAVVEHLDRLGVRATTFTGRNREDREECRISYQQGRYPVIVFTPAEGFNLHAGDTAAGGNDVPRVTVVAEPRWSPKKALQIEGRSQRNGQQAPAYYAYATGTVEETVIRRVIEGMAATAQINGESTAPFDGLAGALGVPFVVGGN